MEAELAELDKKAARAIDQVVAATTAAERRAAKEALDKLRREEADLKARRDAAERERLRRERLKGHHTSEECLRNSLAKGCM
jgi:hypothetical protein